MKEKADYNEADFDTYVSTESLLPGKKGRQTPSSLPQTGKVTVYKAGDILVSNIRPYFKKIWYADRTGTCSGDVLAFRAKQSEQSGYLYSCMRSDAFFDYVMKGAKGTKMPRGDKKQMLTYKVASNPSGATVDFIESALSQASSSSKENHRLAALRDNLLPKLMSGEIDVSKVDLKQLNSHLVVPSRRLTGHLTGPRYEWQGGNQVARMGDLIYRLFDFFPRLGDNRTRSSIKTFSPTEKSVGKGGETMDGSRRPAALLVI